MRSNELVNVNEVAEIFDGGGHEKAAGCTLDCSIDDAIKRLVKEINKNL